MLSMNLHRYGLCGLLVVFLLGCSSTPTGGGKIRVAFVTNNPEEFWKLVEAGCVAQAEKSGVEVEFKRPQNATAQEQKEIIDALVNKGVKAISISVQDPKNQTPYLNEIADKVALLAVDNDAPKSKRKCYIGTDNVKAGRAVGKLIKEAMPKGATLALFVGQLEPDNARERTRGVLEELGFDLPEGDYRPKSLKSKDGKFVLKRPEPVTDDGKAAIAKERANAELGTMLDDDNVCLVGLWAYNPPAILAAATERGLKGKVTIVGFDEDLNTLKGIDEGAIYGTVVQNPYEFGRKSVEVMAKLAKGEKADLPASGQDYIPERIVTKQGGNGRLKASEYYNEVKKILGK
jgi:ribose transport system substrate-binding protein